MFNLFCYWSLALNVFLCFFYRYQAITLMKIIRRLGLKLKIFGELEKRKYMYYDNFDSVTEEKDN